MPDGLPHRISTFLGEFRIIVPALGALLGFQLTSAFQASFDRLSPLDKSINFVGLACTAAAILFLLTPASYHRFSQRVEATESFLRFARACVNLAFVFIPLAIVASLHVQASRSFGSDAAAAVVSGVSLLLFGIAWWLVPFLRAKSKGNG